MQTHSNETCSSLSAACRTWSGVWSSILTSKGKGNVATIYTYPLSQGGASNGHYGGNAKTYMNVGLGMGEAMVELLKNE